MNKIVSIAMLAHEMNKAYCHSIGDNTQPHWEDAPDWQVDSCINGVVYHLDNPDTTPENSHENWLKQKQTDGWVYGPVKDADKKEHPCMMPYNELPAEQRAKDWLFKQAIEIGNEVLANKL